MFRNMAVTMVIAILVLAAGIPAQAGTDGTTGPEIAPFTEPTLGHDSVDLTSYFDTGTTAPRGTIVHGDPAVTAFAGTDNPLPLGHDSVDLTSYFGTGTPSGRELDAKAGSMPGMAGMTGMKGMAGMNGPMKMPTIADALYVGQIEVVTDEPPLGHGPVDLASYFRTYRLVYSKMDLTSIEGLTHHLMVWVCGADGKPLEGAKVDYIVTGRDGTKQKSDAMVMGNGYGGDFNLAAKGNYEVLTLAQVKGTGLSHRWTWEIR